MKEMRTKAELIDELHAEAPRFTLIQLVVGHDNSSTFIQADDPDGLNKLNEAITQGGEPVGFVGAIIEPEPGGLRRVRIYSRTLAEYSDEEWAKRFLERIAEEKGHAIPKLCTQSKTDGSAKAKLVLQNSTLQPSQEGSAASLPALIIPRLLRIRDAAKYLSATEWQMETLVREGTIPFFVLGRRRVIDRLELDRYAEHRNAEAKAGRE
jgi:excisionase family DNA binding protein